MSFAVPATQVSIMFGLMALGWIAFRVRLISAEAQRGMTNLLLYFVSPAVIIQAFQRDFDAERLRTMGLVVLLDLATYAIAIAIASAAFNRRLVPDERRTVLQFGAVYTNAGFIGIPLTQAILGDDGVFYAVAYIAVFNLMVWTHGVSMFGPADASLAQRAKKVLLNPNIVAIVAGLTLFGLSWRLPAPFFQIAGYLATMNTPLSMVVIGASLASLSLRTVFLDQLVWVGALARNLVLPALFALLLWPLPLDHVAKEATMIVLSAPVGATVVMFSVKHGRDARFATRLLTLSTLLSVVTLPGVLVAAGLLW